LAKIKNEYKKERGFMKKFIKKIIIGLTPPIITNLMRKTINSNIHSDEYIDWLCYILGGFLTRGNIRGFVYAIRHMPSGGAIVEIGSFLGLSTNIIAYLAIKYQRDNQFSLAILGHLREQINQLAVISTQKVKYIGIMQRKFS